MRLHLRTGYLDTGNRFPDDEVRDLELWLDSDGKREASFDRCAMCQPSANGGAGRACWRQSQTRPNAYHQPLTGDHR